MITDKLLMFSEAQAVTDTAASTDVIDLGPIDGNVVISAWVTRLSFGCWLTQPPQQAVMQL